MEDNRYIEYLLEETMKHHGTDLHICVGSKPLIRVNSRLRPIEGTEIVKPPVVEAIVDQYLSEKKKMELERNKTVDMSYSIPRLGRFRCNFYLQRGTVAIAIRSLPLEIPDIESLRLPEDVLRFTTKKKGLVIITGATGSGKSTTLASLIAVVNKEYDYHITTIEDPVEYLHKHNRSLVTQKEVGSDANSFVSALRGALREDPDVIMVGEMRDMETIAVVLTAAETGHLVFSTLHTSGAVKSIDRIIDGFPLSQQDQIRSQLATTLEGVITQHLIPRKDREGMVLACEIMVMTPAIRNLIREGKHYQINNLIQGGRSDGMHSLERELAKLCKEGIIDEDEARLRASDSQLFDSYL
ncbi:MAG: PilT/PilU family type 4a pilus ATPase [Clostridia bacterium]|nr:PilT/PilU family type 4a pilus ATPase [Clostridia bacterium]